MEESNQNNIKFSDRFFSDKTAIIIAVLSMVVLVGAIVFFLIFRSWQFSTRLDEQIVANFGDFIGGVVGTLLAFTAAILYYVALREQRKDVENNKQSLVLQNEALQQQIKEFQQQRVELETTRKVYEKQTLLMTEQSRIMKQQQFESSFYAMLRVFMDCKNQIISKEIDCFKQCVDKIEKGLQQVDNNSVFDRHSRIISLYEDLYIEKRDMLSSYFKTVYRLLCFIDNTSSLENQEKIQYVKIFRAQLSDSETKLLYYNYHSDFSGSARNLAYKLNFLKHYDYLTSVDAQIIYDAELLQDKNLVRFLHQFEEFLRYSINQCCKGFTEKEPPYQMSFEYKNIISEINSNPDIVIQLSVPSKESKLSENFCALFSDFICYRLFLSQFSRKREVLTLAEIGEVDQRRVYSCILHSTFVHKIKTDSDYE